MRYARENVDGSGSYLDALLNLIAANNGRFNLGDGAFQLSYVATSACKDELYSRGCSTRFNADGTCPGATRVVKLSPFGSAVGKAILSMHITSAITKSHYPAPSEPNIGYSGSRIGFNFCDFTQAYSKGNQYIPHGTITGLYGPGFGGYSATIAATRDFANNQVTLARLGFAGMNGGPLWIWDTACGPCLGPLDGTGQHKYAGQLLPAWDKNLHPTPLPSETFQIDPVPHSGYAHSRWPTSGMELSGFPQDRPHSGTQCSMDSSSCCVDSSALQAYWPTVTTICTNPPSPSNPPCCEPSPGNTTTIMNCIDTAQSSAYGPCFSRTEATCSGELSCGGGMGNMGINVQVPGGGQVAIETLGDLACDPVTKVCATFYFQFPYLPCDVQGCEDGTNCRTLFPPRYITWTFTVTN